MKEGKMGEKQRLIKSAQKIKKDIYLYPIIIVLLTIGSMTLIIYNSIENFKHKEEHELKTKLLNKEKELSKGQLEQAVKLINYHKNQTMKILKKSLKQRVYEANKIIQNIIKENPNKNKKELKHLVSIALSPIRFFDGRGYYLVYDKDTKQSVIHPVKKFVGKDMSQFRDKKGQLIVKLFDDAIEKNGEGFTSDIYFVKPHIKDNKEYAKHIFVKYIKELNWVIGTGDYFDEVEKSIQKEVLKSLNNVRYGTNGYLWIMHANNYKLLMHPYRPNAIGSSQKEVKDIKGNNIAAMSIKTAKNNPQGSFLNFYWEKPNSTEQIKKISFVKYIPQWNWVIGTGVYLDDINNLVSSQQYLYDNKIKSLYNNIFMVSLLVIIITVFIAINLSRRIKKGFDNYSLELHKINKELESKVSVRTKELNLLNQQLEEKIEEELEKNRFQEIQLLEQAKFAQMGEMIGNIAHQWRQPLSILSSVSSSMRLQMQLDNLSKKDALKNLDMFRETTQHLSHTIDQFRDFIKEERKLKKSVLKDVIENVLSLTQATLKHHHINILKEFEKDSNIVIRTVSGELTQVLINIINNAKDALSQNSNKEKWIKVSYKNSTEDVTIYVEDNAGGIKESILPKIFDPYFTTKHQSQGTGIGLYMCKKIIEQNLKGNLYAQNTKNGACFIIKIPHSLTN